MPCYTTELRLADGSFRSTKFGVLLCCFCVHNRNEQRPCGIIGVLHVFGFGSSCAGRCHRSLEGKFRHRNVLFTLYMLDKTSRRKRQQVVEESISDNFRSFARGCKISASLILLFLHPANSIGADGITYLIKPICGLSVSPPVYLEFLHPRCRNPGLRKPWKLFRTMQRLLQITG